MSINGVIGLPRSGKSTLFAKLAKKYNKKGMKVYSNFYIKGCYQLDFDLLGKVRYEDCVMLIDEIALFADCRNFKEFGKDLVYFFTNHGHYNIEIWWASQSMDCDKKIRNLTETLYYVRPAPLLPVSYLRQIVKSFDTETMTDCYKLVGFPKFVFRPLYYNMFDSYNKRDLPPVIDVPWDSSPSSSISQRPSEPDNKQSKPRARRLSSGERKR